MNKKAEFNTQGLVIGLLTVGLVATLLATLITDGGSNYNTDGYDPDRLGEYKITENISSAIDAARPLIDENTVDKNAFDYLASLWNKALRPFKFVYRTYQVGSNLAGHVASDLNLLPVISTYLITLFAILVIIGIVLIKFTMGRKK